MEAIINISKSIRKKRLFYKTGVFIADYIVTYISSIIFIILASLLPIANIDRMPLYATAMFFAFIIWMIANLALFNVLIEMKGGTIESNRKQIIKLVNEYFKLDIEDQGQTIIRNTKSSGFIRWGRIVTVLLDGNSVYVNIQSLGRSDAFSLFHGFSNYLKCKRIAKRFSQVKFQENRI